jgi:tetratricopeptide (TPR) repeat protein
MNNIEWFRRSTWSDADRTDFNARLKRCRSASNRAQYLRIQALHLAEAGHHEGAIELLDRLLVDFPDSIDIAQAHTQKGDSLAKLGQTESAIEEYRAALRRERVFPNVRTNAWLSFGWLVVEKQLTGHYDEVSQFMESSHDESGLTFPASEYRYAAIQALLADARGDKILAREFAKAALAETAKDHSGLRYHPKVGLVGSEQVTFANRLRILAGPAT